MEIPSETQEPLFDLKNFFRPTAKNVLLWGTVVKSACITLIGFSLSIIFSATSTAIIMAVTAILVGGIAELFILFTREKPVDTLLQAVVDVKEEANQPLLPVVALATPQPCSPLTPIENGQE